MFNPQDTVGLVLANGFRIGLVAGDESTCQILSKLAKILHLIPIRNENIKINLVTDANGIDIIGKGYLSGIADAFCKFNQLNRFYFSTSINHKSEPIICTIKLKPSGLILFDLRFVSDLILLVAHSNHGLLIHGALAKNEMRGIILSGPGGAGKTTASNRLAFPWISMSDDATLVVGDNRGKYWAHPWPTWSRIMMGKEETWNVSDFVSLKAFFFMNHSQQDEVILQDRKKSIILINDAAKQITGAMPSFFKLEEKRVFNNQAFNIACSISLNVPCNILNISLNGQFWLEIEKAIEIHHG